MSKRIHLSIIVSSALFLSLACISSVAKEVPTKSPTNDAQIPTTNPTSPSSANTYPCINKYLPIVDDATKVYAVNTTIGDSTVSSTNYETIFYWQQLFHSKHQA